MGDIANDEKCQADGCGHMASAHADTDDGANTGACSMASCDCSGMTTASGDASVIGQAYVEIIPTVPALAAAEIIAPGNEEFAADLAAAAARSAHGIPLTLLSSLKSLPMGGCFRTGCSHTSANHLDLDEGLGLGKCMADGCQCHGFMPEGSPGEPALPEPTATVDGAVALSVETDPAAFAVGDNEPGEPGGGPEEPAPDMDGYPFRALLMQEGVETSDGRFIEPNATTWRTPPLSLAYQDKTEHGGFADTAAVNIGRIDTITREAGAAPGTFDIWGEGVIDDDDPLAVMAAHKIAGQFLRGVSVDLAIQTADIEITAVDEDGWPIGERFIVTSCEIGMATVTSFPAFGDCQIELTGEMPSEAETVLDLDLPDVGDRIPIIADAAPVESFTWHLAEPDHVEERAEMTLLASGGPMAPPRDWFEQPTFRAEDLIEIPPHLCAGKRNVKACPLTILDDGRVYGHVASWFVEHTAMTGRHIKAPRNAGYDLFNSRGVVRCDDATDIPVGQITLDGGHADLRLGWRQALAHYDDTRSAVIDCRVGTDEHGIWMAGALRPDVDDLSLRRLRAASISGDWRPLGGRQEFIAACSVNAPGFPTLRAAIAASAGSVDSEMVALVAAGALPTRPEPTVERLLDRAIDELAYVRREREAERLDHIIG